jgi:hypothetical protein
LSEKGNTNFLAVLLADYTLGIYKKENDVTDSVSKINKILLYKEGKEYMLDSSM